MPTVNDPRALLQAAVKFHQAGELARAAQLYERVLRLSPADPNALHLFGLVRHQQGAHAEGAAHIRRAVDLVPDNPVLRSNLGDALRRAGEPLAAIEQLRAALALRPDHAGVHLNLGAAYGDIQAHEAALRHAGEAVRLAPELAEAHYNLGRALFDQLRLEGAVVAFREALRRRPDYPVAADNLLYLLNLIPGLDPWEVAAEHRRVCGHLDHLARPPQRKPNRGPDRLLRIGYVSRDFRAHAVNYFFEPVLAHHDRRRFRVYCYSDVESPDAVTARLKGLADQWRDSADWSDRRLDEQVRADRVDILVDLGGHTEKNRLLLFARKPAPLQISWLGYPNTTGLAAMDYRIVDAFTAPEGEIFHGCEAPLRLPQLFACFRPPDHAPPVSPAPAAETGQVTFGALHKLEKINPAVIRLWSRLLQALPDARLLIARDQIDSWQRQRLEEAFAALGIDLGRLLLRSLNDPTRSFFEQFKDIDIFLDVFPWSGHTLACCALWQGAPVITLEGSSHAGRMVSSLLHVVGLERFIARDEAHYLRIAAESAADIPTLAALRANLRHRVAASPLRDEPGFTRTLEESYAKAWTERS